MPLNTLHPDFALPETQHIEPLLQILASLNASYALLLLLTDEPQTPALELTIRVPGHARPFSIRLGSPTSPKILPVLKENHAQLLAGAQDYITNLLQDPNQ